MKKICGFLLACFLSGSISWAGVPGLQVEMAPGAGISAAGTGPYDLGLGGGLYVGLRLDPILSIGVEVSAYTFSLSNIPGIVKATGGITTMEAEAKVKLRSSGAPIHLLVTAGAGLGSFSNNGSSNVTNPATGITDTFSVNFSVSDPMVEGGLGLEANLRPGAELYLLGQVHYLFNSSGNFWHLPLMAGASFSF